MWCLTLSCCRTWEQNISELLHPSSTKSFPLDQSWSDLIPQECNILLRGTVWISGWEQMLGKTRRPRSSQQSWNRCCSTVTLFSPGVYLLMFQKKNSDFFFFTDFYIFLQLLIKLCNSSWSSRHLHTLLHTRLCISPAVSHLCWNLPSWWSHGKYNKTLEE